MANAKPKRRIQPATSSASDELPDLPEIPNRPSILEDGWDEPATEDQVADAVAIALTLFHGNASDQYVQVLKRLVRRRGYSQKEIAYAIDAMAYDVDLTQDSQYPGFRLLPGHFEQIIKENRRHRTMLRSKLTATQVRTLLEQYPELSRQDFQKTQDAGRDRDELFRYKPESEADAITYERMISIWSDMQAEDRVPEGADLQDYFERVEVRGQDKPMWRRKNDS